jgi:TPR repeat protein
VLFEAFAAQREGRIDEARRLFAQVAAEGDMRGAYQLGRSLADEADGPPDHAAAARWYRWGAEHGHPPCARELGTAYELSRGLSRDPAEAMRWYGIAAEQGDAAAMRLIGLMVLRGDGVRQDAAAACRWLEAAAEREDQDAALALAGLYERGDGVATDPPTAAHWYWVAAGEAEDQYPAPVLAGLRRLVPALDRLAASGDADAQFYLARVKTEGIDERRSLQYMQAAARQGHTEACYAMAILYRDGQRGLPRDLDTSFRWCHASASAGWWPAQHDLGLMYARGYGVPTDIEEARRWFQRAAEQGDTQSMFELWLTAAGRPQADREEALRWLRLAAAGGVQDAMWYLGDAYLDGDCVPRDPIQAARWFMASVRKGGSGQHELVILAEELTAEQLREADRLSGGDGALSEDLIQRAARATHDFGFLRAR